MRRMTAEEARARADEVRATSATILRGLFPVDKIDAWNAAFQPLLAAGIERDRDDPNRGREPLLRHPAVRRTSGPTRRSSTTTPSWPWSRSWSAPTG